MNNVEGQIAKAIGQYLAVRSNRIACDGELLVVQMARGGALVTSLSGKAYEVEILVTRILP